MGPPRVSRLRWSDLRLDDAIPHIVWRAETQKNRRRAVLALAPELVYVLRRHRAQVDDQNRVHTAKPAVSGAVSTETDAPDHPRAHGSHCQSAKPDNPLSFTDNAPVFEARPNPRTFTTDAERAGLVLKDRDGASLSFHSARKWFSTTLTNAGVSPRMVDHLMRHTGSVEARYFRPTLEEQADALRFLPSLGLVIQGVTVSPPKTEHPHCRQMPTGVDTQGATSELPPVHLTRENSTPHLSAAGRPKSRSDEQSEGAGSSIHAEQGFPLASGLGCASPSAGRNRGYDARNLHQTVRSLVEANRALTDAIEALLLREEHEDGQQSQT